VQGYVREVKNMAENQANQIRERNREISDGAFTAISDPSSTSVPPQPEAVPPHLDFAPLDAAVAALGRSADHYQHAFERTGERGKALGNATPANPLSHVNGDLLQAERALTDPAGLPGRPWYKHQLYAPGFYTGYSVKTIPAVREAIEQKQWDAAARAIVSVSRVLESEAATIERAATDLDHAPE